MVQKKVVHVPARASVTRHQQVRRNAWTRGHRMNDWRARSQVRDYRRYGLRAPASGQTWVKVDNSYLLITMATGLIAAVAAAN